MKKPAPRMNPLSAPIVTSSFQNQVLLLKKHEKNTLGMNPLAAPSVPPSSQNHQVLIEMIDDSLDSLIAFGFTVGDKAQL